MGLSVLAVQRKPYRALNGMLKSGNVADSHYGGKTGPVAGAKAGMNYSVLYQLYRLSSHIKSAIVYPHGGGAASIISERRIVASAHYFFRKLARKRNLICEAEAGLAQSTSLIGASVMAKAS